MYVYCTERCVISSLFLFLLSGIPFLMPTLCHKLGICDKFRAMKNHILMCLFMIYLTMLSVVKTKLCHGGVLG